MKSTTADFFLPAILGFLFATIFFGVRQIEFEGHEYISIRWIGITHSETCSAHIVNPDNEAREGGE